MSSHDFVIIGAGSAGCVLANRLSAGGANVLLLESGGSAKHLGVKAPAAFSTLFQSPRDWNYLSEPEPALFGRRLFLPRGRMLGGSSSMNAMMYVRGNRADYDGWARGGAAGWSYDEVLPYFKRSEDNAEFHDSYHGVGGEQHVTSSRWLSTHWEPFLESAAAVGIPRIADCNGPEQDGGVLVQTTTRRGRRWSAADAFLAPVRTRPGLTIMPRAHVRRIVIEGGRAVAAEYEQNGKRQTARAEREVILSAGAYGSPQLLMLSGIGPADHLRDHGIEVRVDQPNVGAHLQEHPMALVNLRCATPDTLDDAASPKYLLPWLLAGRGKLSSNVAEAALHWRSDPSLPAPDFQFVFGPVYYWEHGFRKTGAPALTIGPVLIGPSSRGSVRLRSADPADHPRILNNLLGSDAEVAAMLRALELAREIASKPPFSKHAVEELNPSTHVAKPRGADGLAKGHVRARVPPDVHVPDRITRGRCRRPRAARARRRGAEGGGCIGNAEDHLRQHARSDADDRRALLGLRAGLAIERR